MASLTSPVQLDLHLLLLLLHVDPNQLFGPGLYVEQLSHDLLHYDQQDSPNTSHLKFATLVSVTLLAYFTCQTILPH